VAAIKLAKGDEVVAMDVIHPDANASLLVVTTKGLGKRTQLKAFPRQGRAGGGVRAITLIGKSGHISVARVVSPDDDLVVISTNGQVIRMFADSIPHKGRPAQGVAVMSMRGNDDVASIARIPRTDKSGKMIGDEDLEVLSEDEIAAGISANGNRKGGDAAQAAPRSRARAVAATRPATAGPKSTAASTKPTSSAKPSTPPATPRTRRASAQPSATSATRTAPAQAKTSTTKPAGKALAPAKATSSASSTKTATASAKPAATPAKPKPTTARPAPAQAKPTATAPAGTPSSTASANGKQPATPAPRTRSKA